MKFIEAIGTAIKNFWQIIRPGWLFDWRQRRETAALQKLSEKVTIPVEPSNVVQNSSEPLDNPNKENEEDKLKKKIKKEKEAEKLKAIFAQAEEESKIIQEAKERMEKLKNKWKEDDERRAKEEKQAEQRRSEQDKFILSLRIERSPSEEEANKKNVEKMAKNTELRKAFKIADERNGWQVCLAVLYQALSNRNLLNEIYENNNLMEFITTLKYYINFYVETFSTDEGFNADYVGTSCGECIEGFYNVLRTLAEVNPIKNIFNAIINVFFKYETPLTNSDKELEEKFNQVKISLADLIKAGKKTAARELLYGEIIRKEAKINSGLSLNK